MHGERASLAGVVAAAIVLALITPLPTRAPVPSATEHGVASPVVRRPVLTAGGNAKSAAPAPALENAKTAPVEQRVVAQKIAKIKGEAAVFTPSRPKHDPRAPKETVSADTLLVHYPPGTTDADREGAARDAGGRSLRFLPELGVDVVSVPASSRDDASAKLASDRRVARVELDPVRHIVGSPDDEFFTSQTPLYNSRLPAAWDVTHGGAAIDIAIVDTGVKLNHPDLSSRIVPGIDIVNSDSNASDDQGHGTAVAGVAAADTNNGVGIAGSAWTARIMPVKVLDSSGSGNDSDIATGIVWATDHGAEIINLSLAGPDQSTTMSDAVDYATAHGVVVVAAAGNESSDAPSYPAAFPSVISVGATDFYGDVAHFSNRGSWLDVVAEGVAVITTCAFSCSTQVPGYVAESGTSFSSPLVAGIAALVLAKNPAFTPAQVQARIKTSALDRGPRGIDDYYGWGLVDAYAAVGGRGAAPPPAPVHNETDDVAVNAVPLGASGSSSISPEGDVDWVSRDVPGAGAITLTVTPEASDDGSAPQTFVPEVTAWSPLFEHMGGSFLPSGCTFDPLFGLSPACYGSPTTATINVPAAGLYRFRISNRVSARTNTLTSQVDPYTYTSSFVAGPGGTPAGPKTWVTDASPVPFSFGVSTAAHPTMTFARDLTPASVTTTTVRLNDGKTAAAIPTTVAYVPGTKQVTITPTGALLAGRTYVMSVTGVTDATDTMAETFKESFTVVPAPGVPDLNADFNNDGFEDVVIGSPGEDNGTIVDGGVVHVLYGHASGATGAGSQMWSQDSTGILGGVEKGDRFGEAVATGDLNNDGFDDLVIGVPYEDIGTIKDAGAIHVLLGSASGLRSTGNQLWYQGSAGVPGNDETNDRFGATLAIGAFDGVTGDDLAIGAPGEAVGTATGAGAVTVLRGGAAGLVTSGAQQWTQNTVGVDAVAQAGDGFGASLAAGDLQGDGNDDLAMGAPSDNLSADEGTVTLARGSIVGLRPIGVVGDFAGDGPQAGDAFGYSVAIVDVGGYAMADGYGDLVIGEPGQKLGSAVRAGRVNVLFSDHTDLAVVSSLFDQSTFGIGTIENDGRFGASLSGRRLTSETVLAIGSPFDDIGSAADSGSVQIVRASSAPLADGVFTLGGVRQLAQGSGGVPGSAETADRFGTDVSVIDVDGDGFADLVVGTPLEGIANAPQAGAVLVAQKITNASPIYTLFTQDTTGIASTVEAGDKFGTSVD